MVYENRIEKLEKKVQELESLRNQVILNNEIKNTLLIYQENNKKLADSIDKVEETIKEHQVRKEWWECNKCPIPIIIYILIGLYSFNLFIEKYYCVVQKEILQTQNKPDTKAEDKNSSK